MASLTIYLAGRLFNVGERFDNARLALCLRGRGRQVILPQEEALGFVDPSNGSLRLDRIAIACRDCCVDKGNVLVANIDGPDADSGTSLECGLALATTGRAIVYRTDFRTDPAKEIGVNAMFQLPGITHIFKPCLLADLEATDNFYLDLAAQIDEAVRAIEDREAAG